MAASSLGVCHETYGGYSYPAPAAAASSLCFPPSPLIMADDDVFGDDGGVAAGRGFFPAPPYFMELGRCPSDYSLPPPPPPVVHAAGSEYGGSSSSSSSLGRIGFRTRSEVEVLDDGYKWRKYGKKAVKSSPNPRNYYRCSAAGCGVKKRVERDPDDRRYVVTTYDGVHNHATPGVAGPGGGAGHAYRLAAPEETTAPTWCLPAPAPAPATALGSPPPHAWGAPQLHAAAAAAHSSESSFSALIDQ